MMNFFTRTLIFAALFCSICAVPHFTNEAALEQNFYRMVFAQMRSALIDPRALTPAGTACANNYNNSTSAIGNTLTNATSSCEDAANRTNTINDQQSNATVSNIRSQLLTLQQNLQSCSNLTDNASFLNCTVSSFDANLKLLDNSNSLAYQTLSQLASNATAVDAQRSNCINAATSNAKVQSIQAANDFNSCLQLARNQRDFVQPQQHEQPQAQEQQPQQLLQIEHDNKPESEEHHEEPNNLVNGTASEAVSQP